MKKRILSIFLTVTMLLTLMPMAAFAESGFNITNGTPESEEANNHGYITIDKETAEESDIVTVTVNLSDGYQLKSLTVTPTGFIDLGIKDAEGKPLYWKETNLGASNPQDPGDHYMWGATALMYSAVDYTKTEEAFTFVTQNPYGDNYKNTWDASLGFNFNNVPFADGVFKNTDGERNVFTKYTTIDKYAKSGTPDNITTLQPEDDAATVKNANWHTPTYDELVALSKNCVLVWTDNYNSTGNAGYIVYKAKNDADKGKANMNGTWKMWDAANSKYIANTGSAPTGYSTSDIHIFLPAAGIGSENKLNNLNIGGCYWSGTLGSNNETAYALVPMKIGISLSVGQRQYGYSIRPVMNVSGITPAKQDDGTYQFTMPGYDVTVTAEFEEVPVTIADIFPSNFPASKEDNSWCNSENDNVYIYKTDSNLVFNDSTEDIYNISLSSSLTKEENITVSYKYSKDETEIQFNMTGDNNDELDSIIVSDCTNTSCIGTYAAPKAFSVTYNANGATSGTVPAAQTKTAGVDLTLATNTGSLAKAGYTFAGWNTKADGSGTPYDIGATYTTDAALTLYAEWKVTHTHNPVKVNGQAATETASGWKDYYKCDCDALFEDKNGTMPIENLDTWKAEGGNGYIPPLAPKSYTVTFNMNGHGTQIAAQTVKEGNKATEPATPSENGYSFDGWYMDSEFNSEFNFDSAITKDISLYAKWTCLHENTEIRDAKDATCAEDGYTGDICCLDCEKIIEEGEVIPAIEHTWEKDFTVDKEPTYEEEGSKSIHCTKCEATKDVTAIPTLEPTPTTDPEPSGEPTPTNDPIPSGEPTPSPKPSGEPTPTVPPTTPTPEPELNVGDFVDRCYEVALGREADEEGYNYWKDQLTNGEACGAQVGFGFIFSSEYANKNTTNEQFVTDMYSMFFGREADEAGYNYWLEQLNAGTATREQVFAGFANSEEFYNLCNKYGVVSGAYVEGVANDQQGGVNCFVARLYKVCLNRLPDMGGQAGWVQKLLNGEVSGSSCAYGFVFSEEFTNMNLDNVNFVNYMYKAFFGREADEDGLNYWVDTLNAGTATREDVFNGFIGSAEFANLCASYGINV